MNSERDATRIVRTWLESGSTAIPDRVVDAVLAELPSRPQRQSGWSPRRSQPMKLLLPIAAIAAVIAVVAVVIGGRFLPNESNVGVPTSSPTPLASPTSSPTPSASPTSSPTPSASPTQSAVGGHFVFGDNWPVDIDATSDGTSLSGSVVGSFDGTEFIFELQCLRRYDAQTWMLAGVATQSAVRDQPDGSWVVVVIRDGVPQQAGIYLTPASTADDCEEYVSEVPDSTVEGPGMIGDMSEGSITLPPRTALPVGGQFTFAGDIDVTVDAASDGLSLSGTTTGTFNGEPFIIEHECLRQFDDRTWMLAGVLATSADPNVPDGSWGALIVRDGSPQQAGIQTKPHGLAADCEDFVRNISDSAVEGFEMIGPMDEGSITLPLRQPPAPSASPAS